MANEFKIKNGLLVSGSITGVTESLSDDSGKMASTGWIRSYLSTNGYLTSVTSSAVTTALGYTPVTNARSITINGTTYDLSADRSWTIAAGLTSFNTRTGAITLSSADVTGALGYTPMPTITFVSPLYVASGGEVNIRQANSIQNGYLSSTDWNTFNNKLSTATAASTYLPLSGGTLTGGLVGTTVNLTANNAILILTSPSSTGYASTTYAADGRSFVTGVGGSAAGVTGTRNSYYIYDGTADALRFYINSAGAATFSSSVTASSLFVNNINGTGVVNAYSSSSIGTYIAKSQSATANFVTTGVLYPRGLGYGAIVGAGNTTDIPVNNSAWNGGYGGNIGFWSDIHYGTEGGTNSVGYTAIIKGSGDSTSFGFFADLSAAAGGSRYGIYAKGEAKNYFSGLLGIGTTSPNGKLTIYGGEIGSQLTFTKDAPSGAYGRLGQDSNGTFLTQNAKWDGSSWTRDNTGGVPMALSLHNGNGRYEFRIASNGANPISWSIPLIIEATGQIKFSNYTGSSSFTGTAAGYLAFDSSGNVITVAGVAATDNTKLPLVGGTMTGSINMSGTQIILSSGYAGIEYHNTSGQWEGYVGTESGTGNLRYNSRTGNHTWYSNSTQKMTLSAAGKLTLSNGLTNGSGEALVIGGSGDVRISDGGSIFFGAYDYGTSTYIRGWDDSNLMRFYINGTNSITFTSNGISASAISVGSNAVLHAGNYSSYRGTQLVSPNGASVVAADSAMPDSGHSFIHTLGLGPGGNDGHILGMSWASTTTIYGAQIWVDTDPNNRMAFRSRSSAGVWTGWNEVIHSSNYSSYALPISGGTTTGVVTFSGSSNSVDNVRFQNTDGNYAYIRQTSNANTNNVWYDGTLGAVMWYAWDNPGSLRTANVYTTHKFGTGRGTANEAVTINRGAITGTNSSGTTTYSIGNDGFITVSGGTISGNLVVQGGGNNGSTFGIVSRDITAARSSTSGVIYLGSDGNRYLYYNGSEYVMPGASLNLSGGAVVNNTDGGTFLESNTTENNNWLFRENSKHWGIFYFNRGTQAGQNIGGGYSSVGAETIFLGGNVGTAMPSAWTGYHSSSKIAAYIDHNTGVMFSAGSMRAPLFYDSDNPAYYLDPNSNSRLFSAQYDHIGIGQSYNSSYKLITSGDIYLNSQGNGWAEGVWKQRRSGGTFYDVIDAGNYTSYYSFGNLTSTQFQVGTYVEKTFDLGYFTHGVNNYVAYINFGNIQNSGYLEIEVTSTYSNQSATGLLRKIIPFGTNANNSYWYSGDSKVQEANGSIGDNIFIGDLEWENSTNFRLPIYHVVSSGNAFVARVKWFNSPGGNYSILANATVSTSTRTAPTNWSNNPTFNRTIHTRNIKLFNNDAIGWRYSATDSNTYNAIYSSYDDTTTGITYRSGQWTSSQGITCHRFQTYTNAWVDRLVIYQDGGVTIPGQLTTNYRIVLPNMTIGYWDSANNRIESGSSRPLFLTAYSQPIKFGIDGGESMRLSTYGQLLINATSSGYGASGYGYNLGVRGNGSQVYMSLALSGQTLDTQGLIIGVDTSYGRFHLRDNKGIMFANNDAEKVLINTSGSIIASGDITAYGSPSDARLKTIKSKVTNATEKVTKLNGYHFDWNEVSNLAKIKEDVGVIAQEVADVFPELARTNDDGFMSVRYQGLTAVLIEAVKEQQTQIESQQSEIAELKDLVKQLLAK